MKKIDTLRRVRQILRFLSGISSALFWSELVLLTAVLVLTPMLYVLWNKTPHSLSQEEKDVFSLVMGVIGLYFLKNIFRNSIRIIDNVLLGKIFSQNNSMIIWNIFRKIVCFVCIGFCGDVLSSLFDPATYGPFSWTSSLSDLADFALCLGLLYLIALLFEMGVQLQSEMDEVI
ncbi:hypothetical protein [Gluconobacter sp.]|uniref:hypothetical protein n=1 Tax=Gluconobacter sp. TaxID=1876758 RepID=UPI0039E8CAC0